ncbi:MAG TPA: hypothetical protein VHO29_10555 [Marmoricola sp.]|nr:hypothetical protein [Marmoricola sp.]
MGQVLTVKAGGVADVSGRQWLHSDRVRLVIAIGDMAHACAPGQDRLRSSDYYSQ